MKSLNRIDKLVQQELDRCPLPWSLIPGKKHIKIMIAGEMVDIMPTTKPSEMTRRASLNVRATIRRFVREKSAVH